MSDETRITGQCIPPPKHVLPVSRIRIRIHDPDRHQNLIICSLAHCQPSLKISCKSVPKFLRKLLTDRQTNKQTYAVQVQAYIYILRIKVIRASRSLSAIVELFVVYVLLYACVGL